MSEAPLEDDEDMPTFDPETAATALERAAGGSR